MSSAHRRRRFRKRKFLPDAWDPIRHNKMVRHLKDAARVPSVRAYKLAGSSRGELVFRERARSLRLGRA